MTRSRPEQKPDLGAAQPMGNLGGTCCRTMRAGSFIMFCAGSPHFGQITADTIIQAHGVGPWRTRYVNPADDPAACASRR